MNILDSIGNTPLMSIDKIYFKMEMMNPSGSIKDRIAKEMLLPYVSEVHKHFTVVEATSGNTGISVAMICAALGLGCWIVCPPNTSPFKIKLMRKYGAKIDVARDIETCIQKAKRMIQYKRADVYPDQFTNLYNIIAQNKMGREARLQYNEAIYNSHWDLDYHQVGAIVAGTGTGGTLMGLHNAFPKADVWEVCTTGEKPIEGITDCVVQPLIPQTLNRSQIKVTYKQAKQTADMLMRKGFSCGISSGANYYAASIIAAHYDSVLTVFADNRERYL